MISTRSFAAMLTVLCAICAAGCSVGDVETGPLASTDGGSPACPPQQVVGWGDSLTESMTRVGGAVTQADPTWLDTLGQDLDVKTDNFGIRTQGSAEIAVRQGGLKPLVTLSGNEIPSGSTAAVSITAISPTDGWTQFGEGTTMKMHGMLAGVAGTMQHTVSLGVESFSFVPDAAPDSVVAVPARSTFSSNDGADFRRCFQIIWAGGNNRGQKAAIIRDIASMVRWLPAPKRFLIVGTVPSVTDELSAAYGWRFVDLRRWLVSDGLAAAGIAPSPDDTAAIAAGNVPPSLTVDGVHFTQAGYTAIGHHLASVVKELV